MLTPFAQVVGLALVSAIGSTLLVIATKWGVGVGYDSVYYLSAADNLLRGLGLSRLAGGGEVIPLTHFPPLYPLMLAAMSWAFHVSTSYAARVLAAGFFGAVALLSGLLVKDFTKSFWAGATTALFVVGSPGLLSVESWAMSEGPYLVLLVAALWVITAYLRATQWRLLVAGALLAGAAYATRYVGVGLLATGAIVIFASSPGNWLRRSSRAVAFVAIGVLPALAWMIRNSILTGVATNRTLIFHPVGRSTLALGAHSLAAWLFPDRLPFRLNLLMFTSILVLLAVYWALSWLRAGAQDPKGWDRPSQLAGVLTLHAVAYAGLLFVSLTFFDASTPLSTRILSPLLVTFMPVLIMTVWHWRRTRTGGNLAVSVAALGLGVLLISGGLQTWAQAKRDMRSGLGFNSLSWVRSPTIAWVRELNPDAVLTSNEAFPVYYLTGRPVYAAPEAIDPVKAETRPSFHSDLEAMRERLRMPDSYLVVFHPDQLRPELPPLSVLTQGLNTVVRTPDALILAGR